jgi:3-phytase
LWLHPTVPGRSLILATDKIEGTGGLYVFGLDGALLQSIAPLDRPNNVDVEYGLMAPGGATDIAVVTERMQHRLRVFAIPPDGPPLKDLAPMGLPVLEGQQGAFAEPMGIAMYRRPGDGAVFAIVAPKLGGPSEYLWQYRLAFVEGALRATLVRRFGAFSERGPVPGEPGEIEAVVVDDERGYVYYADERYGIHKWHADPDHPDAARELAVFGLDGYDGDREGLALYRQDDGTGYLVSSDQVPGGSRLLVYPREGLPGRPHAHPRLRTIPTPADETDGLDVTSRALPGFPDGILVMMNSGAKNFLVFPSPFSRKTSRSQ